MLEPKIVRKLWGWEEWIVNTPQYCGKVLNLNPGYQCSFHYHPVKDETFMCIAGLVQVEYINEFGRKVIENLHGDTKEALRMPPGTPHRFMALGAPATLVEFSTTHSDLDVVRLEESGPCPQ